jgi:hypothetical protein
VQFLFQGYEIADIRLAGLVQFPSARACTLMRRIFLFMRESWMSANFQESPLPKTVQDADRAGTMRINEKAVFSPEAGSSWTTT